MFDLGMQELVVIFVVALLVFGPKKLPELGRALGKGLMEMKIALRGVKASFEEIEEHARLDDVSRQKQEGRRDKVTDVKDRDV